MCRSPTEQHFIRGGQTTKILGAARFQPGTAGCEAQKLPLCCAAPFKIGKNSFVMLPRNLRKYVWIFCLCMQRDRFLLTVNVPILMELNPNRLIFF